MTLLTYVKNWDYIEKQTSKGAEIAKKMRIIIAEQGSLDDELFDWLCCASPDSIPMEGPTV